MHDLNTRFNSTRLESASGFTLSGLGKIWKDSYLSNHQNDSAMHEDDDFCDEYKIEA